MDYKPFDLEAAKRGEKVLVLNRDKFPAGGEIGEILESRQFDRLVVFQQDGNPWTAFRKDGSHPYGCYRLVMAPKPKKQVTRWVNVYRDSRGFFSNGMLYEFETVAKANGSIIATVPLTFEVEE